MQALLYRAWRIKMMDWGDVESDDDILLYLMTSFWFHHGCGDDRYSTSYWRLKASYKGAQGVQHGLFQSVDGGWGFHATNGTFEHARLDADFPEIQDKSLAGLMGKTVEHYRDTFM